MIQVTEKPLLVTSYLGSRFKDGRVHQDRRDQWML
jgi:hypothetical protein